MKKFLAIVAVSAFLISCGGASTTPTTTDSTVVKADTTLPAVDTTKAVDTAK